jgi:hypothetical protein
MVKPYLHFSICLHGTVHRNNFTLLFLKKKIEESPSGLQPAVHEMAIRVECSSVSTLLHP